MSKNKKKPLPPRRLRMNRGSRLQAARTWLAQFRGEHIARAYSRWFGVDRISAIRELCALGVQLDPGYVQAVERRYSEKSRSKQSRQNERPDSHGTYGVDFDEHFAFIAGHTEGDAPFGVRWEER
jgi:hypothetical protein